MQRCLIGQRDLWSLRVAIPTCLWFPASRGVKCRVELVPRGGSGAGGNPRLCQPGKRPSLLPEGWLAPPGSPAPRIAPTLLPPLPATLRPAGGHGPGGRTGTSRSLSPTGLCEPQHREGHRRPTPCPAALLHRSNPAQNFPQPAAGSGAGGAALPGLPLPAPPARRGRRCPQAPPGRTARCCPGHRPLLAGAGGLLGGREGVRLGPSPALGAGAMSHCQQRCKRQLGRVIRFFYQFVTGTLSQGRYHPGGHGVSVL